MAGVMTRGQFNRTLTEMINDVVGLEYDVYEGEWENFFSKHKTERAEVRDVVIPGLGAALVKPEGESVRYDTTSEFYQAQYVVTRLGLGFQLSEESIEDNLYIDLATALGKSLGQSFGYAKDIIGASVLNNGFLSTFPGGDGVSLFNTAHPLRDGGTWSNTFTTNPDISEESLEDAAVLIDGFVNDRGLPSAAKIDKLIVPRQSKFIAARILGNSMRPNTANRDINALVMTDTLPDAPIVCHYLTNTNFWMLTVKGSEITDQGLKYFQRTPFKKSQEPEFNSGNYRYKATERFAFGWTNARGAVASSG